MQRNSEVCFSGLQPQSQLVNTLWPLQTLKSLSQEISLLSVLSHLVKEIILFFMKVKVKRIMDKSSRGVYV